MIGDLHIHSRFSRACSKNINFPNLVKWAKVKGLHLLGTSDFTHPQWLEEIKINLVEKNGLFYYEDFPFVLSGEISLMYTQGRGRRVHLVLLAPSLEVVDKINSYFDTKGRRDYDGRPIFKIPCDEFVREMKNISEEIEVIPAHIWTPWFGMLGSKSGFDSLKECFGDETKNIFAIETGMSSDPEMNWKMSELNDKAIVSFSDSHSFWPWRIGREATIFKKADSYSELIRQIRENDFIGTIETDPAYGKYHWDGHRNCGISFEPAKTREIGGVCPKCGNALTIGVENRVDELATQKPEDAQGRKNFHKLLPLTEIISAVCGSGLATKKTWAIYNSFIEKFENEFEVLLFVPFEKLMKEFPDDDKMINAIMKNREGKIKVKPGYDGVYGEAVIGDSQKLLV